MSIKTILKYILICILFIPVFVTAQNPEYDKYGGRNDLKINEGAGFFRLGQIGDKHFLVTPEGNAFKAIGINHTHMNSSTNYDQIIENLKSLGFNSGDYQGPQWMWDRFPYTKGVNLLSTSTWLSEDKFKFEDVFSEQFLTSLENKVKSIVVPMASKKMLIAYFLTDVPVWNAKKDGKGWIDFYIALDENAAGKIEFGKWKEANPNSPEEDFIPIIARQVYSKGTEFIRKYDKNHLIFSDRYGEWDFSDKVTQEVLPFVDGIAVQPKNYLTMNFFKTIYEKFKKPIFLADHVTSYATPEYSNTMGQVATNHTDYLEYYRKSVYDVLSLPYMVGYNKCQYMDEVKGTQLKQGLYRVNGEPYEYVGKLAEVHKSALKNAYSVPEYSMSQQLQDWGAYEDVKQEAIQRIIKHRMGDVQLKVILPNDELLKNAEISVKLKRHDFLWGAVIRENFLNTPYSEVYKETFLKYFNASGFGLTLKPKWRNTDREANTIDDMNWLLENGIYVRGHALAWEGENNMRLEDKAILNDSSLSDNEKGELLLKSLGNHFTHAIPKWEVKCWDVTNEPIANNAVNNFFPNFDTHAHWFKLADSVRRANIKENVVLYENDYQIISAISPWALNRPARYREIIDNHIALGAPVEGIGFQSRIKHGLITPDTIYNRLCDFERYDLPYHATEFEIRDDQSKHVYSDVERSLITEYMLVMYFSHPKVEGFWHWTFSDMNQNQNLDYSLFYYNGTPNINGQIWMDLMDGFFDTELSSSTNSSGETELKGYYGDYEISTEINSDTLTGKFEIDSLNTNPIIIVKLEGNYTPTSTRDIKKK
jgi:GH35 family endo-1,4-beta-xylanase